MFETFLTLFANIWLGLGFINSITFIFLVGVFLSLWLGASVLGLGEWFIKRMPLVHLIDWKRIGSFYMCPFLHFISNFYFPFLTFSSNSDVVHMVSYALLFVNANDRRR